MQRDMDRDTDVRDRDRDTVRRNRGEAALFVVAVVVGIYGLGQGLTGLFLAGRAIDLTWLAVAGIALFVLAAQMGRVHDTWPHRPAVPQGRAGPRPTEMDSGTGGPGRSRPCPWKKVGDKHMFRRIHRDAYSVIVAVLLLAGAIAAMLIYLNPMQ